MRSRARIGNPPNQHIPLDLECLAVFFRSKHAKSSTFFSSLPADTGSALQTASCVKIFELESKYVALPLLMSLPPLPPSDANELDRWIVDELKPDLLTSVPTRVNQRACPAARLQMDTPSFDGFTDHPVRSGLCHSKVVSGMCSTAVRSSILYLLSIFSTCKRKTSHCDLQSGSLSLSRAILRKQLAQCTVRWSRVLWERGQCQGLTANEDPLYVQITSSIQEPPRAQRLPQAYFASA